MKGGIRQEASGCCKTCNKLVCFPGTTKRTDTRAKRTDIRAGVIIFAWKRTNFDLEVVCIETNQ